MVTVSVVDFIYLQVFRSIGYKSIPIDNQIPFDKRRGVIPNINGRVINTGLNSVFTYNYYNHIIGQASALMVQNRHVGTQESHWDKTIKGNCHLKLCMPFVGLAPVRLLRPNKAVLYHVNGKLQRAYYQG